ncbi:MAG: hypothetical protein ABFR50_11245 [Candidatus Fermentibacteria bacterium]
MKQIIAIVLLTPLVFLGGCDSAKRTDNTVDDQADYVLNSTEYKLMLNPEKFGDYEAGFEDFWKIILDVAASEGIAVDAAEEETKVKHRDIRFYDTEQNGLRESGYALRQRTKYKNGEMRSEYELTLRYRRPSAAEALTADLNLAEGFVPKDETIELESDVVYSQGESGEEKTIYSLGNSTVLEQQIPTTLGEAARIFPVLGTLGLPPETELKSIVSIPVDERKVSPGEFDFGDGLKAEIDITVWIIEKGSGKIMIPEFSFDHDYRKDHPWSAEAMRRCTSFMKTFQTAHTDWVVPGTSKTQVLYDLRQQNLNTIDK